jgi:hypothetical protein
MMNHGLASTIEVMIFAVMIALRRDSRCGSDCVHQQGDSVLFEEIALV